MADLPSETESERPVRRRHVFYVSGFDPQGPAHYHRLYAQEAVRQAAVTGYSIDVGARRNAGRIASEWPVRAVWPGGEAVDTTIEFLRWDDIVRAHWSRHRWVVMLDALASTAHQVGNGVLWRILKTSWPAFMALALPPLLVLFLGAWLAATFVSVAGLFALGTQSGMLLAFGLAGVSLGGWFVFGRWAETQVQMAWLMRSTRFILAQARQGVSGLEERIGAFAARIDEVRDAPEIDEVLVVGHSSGAMLAVSAVARALARDAGDSPGGGEVASRRPLSLVTLGECIPVLSYQPEADEFRSELARLARSAALDWIDFTAPADGCCFALVDPTAVCPDKGASGTWTCPKRLSTRWAQVFAVERYAAIKRDRHRLHFQYLMATDRPGPYDYFAITAGPARLAERYAASPSVTTFRDFQRFGGPD